MDYSNFIDEVVEKYNYPNNVRRAIEISIPLMVKKYGASRLEDILNIFRDVEIFPFTKATTQTYDEIKEKMMSGVNGHVVDKTGADYGPSNSAPASTYSYYAVYDENMNVVGEKRWIAIQTVQGYYQDKYEKFFGTNINMPYFAHELGHAFAMQKPIYRKEGNRIYSKHGFYESVDEIGYENGKATVKTIQGEGLIVEEIVDEKMSKDQLMMFFGVQTEKELKEILSQLGESSNVYGGTSHLLAEQLELCLGTENILKWRVDNDMKIKDNFASLCNGTKTASVYFPGEDAYSYFATKVNDIYINNTLAHSFKISVEEYGRLNKIAVFDALAVTSAYREAIGERSFSAYDEQRKKAFANQPEVKEDNQGVKL